MYLVRYSEIGLKGDRTRSAMEKMLIRNILSALRSAGVDAKPVRQNGRIFIDCARGPAPEETISRVFGVKSVSWVETVDFTSLEDLCNSACSYFRDAVAGKTFAVRARRQGNHPFRSLDIEIMLGQMLREISAGVDLEKPEFEALIEVRNSKAYMFSRIIPGPGGLPLGSQSRMLALVSGGLDSPLAAWYMMKRGVMMDFLFISLADPFDTEIVQEQISRLVRNWGHGYRSRLHIVDGSKFLEFSRDGGMWKYPNITFKKGLYELAAALARMTGCIGIVTGESIGQVSSQTAENLYALSMSTSFPVFRPLIGMDKDEIVNAARTRDLLPSRNLGEFCSLFAAKPVTSISVAELESETVPDSAIAEMLETRRTVYPADASPENVQNEIPDPAADREEVTVDLRKPETYREWHVPGAVNVSLDDIEEYANRYGKNTRFNLYCSEGLLSARAAGILRKMGYSASFYSLSEIRQKNVSVMDQKRFNI